MGEAHFETSPFEDERYIGTVTKVSPSSVTANLPHAAEATGRLAFGHIAARGQVGEFVAIDCFECGVLGRILEVRLPERDRLAVEHRLGKISEVHPVGTIQLLATIPLNYGKSIFGVSNYPRVGSKIYSAHPQLVNWIVRHSEINNSANTDGIVTSLPTQVLLELGNLPQTSSTLVPFTPERLFGRHCAILGATGGGKSWTIAHLVGQCANFNSKVILFDATGEYHTMNSSRIHHSELGSAGKLWSTHTLHGDTDVTDAELGSQANPQPVYFPYTLLTESDLFAMFTPSAQSQAPKLREAIRSLKIARLEPTLSTNGCIEKANKPKANFETALIEHAESIAKPEAEFDITKLSEQIRHECVVPVGKQGLWGDFLKNDYGYCVSLQQRIDSIVGSDAMSCIFGTSEEVSSIPDVFEEFFNDSSKAVLRLSLSNVTFERDARAIVANSIGRHLLQLARELRFRQFPLLVILDEAHHFLQKSIGNEELRLPLDAFGLIAKEGRKYGLCIAIATQRPRDIPEDVLSQMGTLILHRLTNHRDREIVERASGDIDRSAAAFIPTLNQGEAVVVGVDFPVPFSIQVCRPEFAPDSRGPDFQSAWLPTDNKSLADTELF